MKQLVFLVKVPLKGTDDQPLHPEVVKQYIKDAVDSWSGQFNPDEDNMFYWCNGKTNVKFVGVK